jgi:hypothetical protein
MLRRRYVVAFLLQFAALYGLLIAPWPGWRAAYGRFFRGLTGAVFASDGGPTIVRFRPAEKPPRPEIYLEILLAQRAEIDAAGNARTRVLGLDTRAVGWVPTALLVALIAATPLPWSRRWRALLTGGLLVHGYLLVLVACYLWNESAGMVPVSFLPFVSPLGEFLEETFVSQIGPSFVVPTLIWFLVVVAIEHPLSLMRINVKQRGSFCLSCDPEPAGGTATPPRSDPGPHSPRCRERRPRSSPPHTHRPTK